MLKLALTAFLLLCVAYLTVCALLFIMQRSMLYYPTLPVTHTEAETIWLKHENHSLKVWRIQGTGSEAIIYFGGNADDVALNIPQLKQLFPKHTIYLHNYRGYGGSSGTPSETALFADACALYDQIKPSHTGVAVIGRSLGTGVAAYLASRRPISQLALVTPFDSMVNVASDIYPFFPVSLLLRDKYTSLHYASDFTSKTLVLIAENDEIIPRKRTDALVRALEASQTTVEVIPNTDHNTIGNSLLYEKALIRFFNEGNN